MPGSRKPSESKPKTETKPRSRAKAVPPPAKEEPEVIGKFPFDREMATFRTHLPELLAREGAYVVIRGEEIAGIRDDGMEALGLGYDRYGAGGFMVREITAVEPVLGFARPVS